MVRARATVREVAGDRLVIDFPALQRAVTPGQSVVLYDGDSCLGGGIIDWANTPPATRDHPELNEGTE